ncbi:MAG: peptide deformylase [Actinobacteria bacterium]|nr:peptide deformylase [Actinomycetota bacterium]
MSILPIRVLGDPVLRERARPVERFDEALSRLAEDMFETMYDAPGVGLAAPQVGRSTRFVVFDDHAGWGRRVLANPEIVHMEGEEEMEEGCLSVPGFYFSTPRATRVVARGLDLDGNPVEYEAEGFRARILQHETDHIDGVLYIDRLRGDVRAEALRAIRDVELGLADWPRREARADREPG